MDYNCDYFPISDEVIQKPHKEYIRNCRGCLEDQPNQLAHYGGCMPNLFAGETWDDFQESLVKK